MENEVRPEMSKPYLAGVVLLTLILPAVSISTELLVNRNSRVSVPDLIGKWFIFWAVGWRLLTAGLRQVINPAFTAKEIFHIEDKASHDIVKELGFANICFGLIGIISFFVPAWRIVSAFGSGLYYGLAAASHIVKRPAGANEKIALVSDAFIFACLAGICCLCFR